MEIITISLFSCKSEVQNIWWEGWTVCTEAHVLFYFLYSLCHPCCLLHSSPRQECGLVCLYLERWRWILKMTDGDRTRCSCQDQNSAVMRHSEQQLQTKPLKFTTKLESLLMCELICYVCAKPTNCPGLKTEEFTGHKWKLSWRFELFPHKDYIRWSSLYP